MIREVLFKKFEKYEKQDKFESPYFIKLLDVDGDGEAELVFTDFRSNIIIYKVYGGVILK